MFVIIEAIRQSTDETILMGPDKAVFTVSGLSSESLICTVAPFKLTFIHEMFLYSSLRFSAIFLQSREFLLQPVYRPFSLQLVSIESLLS